MNVFSQNKKYNHIGPNQNLRKTAMHATRAQVRLSAYSYRATFHCPLPRDADNKANIPSFSQWDVTNIVVFSGFFSAVNFAANLQLSDSFSTNSNASHIRRANHLQVTMCGPMWQVTLRCSAMGSRKPLSYRAVWTGACVVVYALCRACNCDPVGSTNISCDATGQCPCKGNVVGLSCDTCVDGTFNLAMDNAEGCQKCFCSGRGDTCTSATGFMRAFLHSDRSACWVFELSLTILKGFV